MSKLSEFQSKKKSELILTLFQGKLTFLYKVKLVSPEFHLPNSITRQAIPFQSSPRQKKPTKSLPSSKINEQYFRLNSKKIKRIDFKQLNW